MQKHMYGKDYDTETAVLIKKFTYGQYGDPKGYEECLFQTPEGLYFLFVQGGPESPYPAADLVRIGKAKVDTWIESH